MQTYLLPVFSFHWGFLPLVRLLKLPKIFWRKLYRFQNCCLLSNLFTNSKNIYMYTFSKLRIILKLLSCWYFLYRMYVYLDNWHKRKKHHHYSDTEKGTEWKIRQDQLFSLRSQYNSKQTMSKLTFFSSACLIFFDFNKSNKSCFVTARKYLIIFPPSLSIHWSFGTFF